MDNKLYATVVETAQKAKVARNVVYAHVAAGTIRSVWFGRTVGIPRAEIDRIRKEGLPRLSDPDAVREALRRLKAEQPATAPVPADADPLA